ncbi:hypothetical protein ABK040_004931 [Willaertia magna]
MSTITESTSLLSKEMVKTTTTTGRKIIPQLVKQFNQPSYLQFIPATTTNATNESSNTQQQQQQNNIVNHPLIIIFGWYGSTFKYLSKYISIYTNLGFDVLCFIPQTIHLFSTYYSNKAVNLILNLIFKDQQENKNVPFLFHSFSNNGGMFISQLFYELNNLKNNLQNCENYKIFKENCKGLIADCFPGFNSKDIGVLYILSGYRFDIKNNKILENTNNNNWFFTRWFNQLKRFLMFCCFYFLYRVPPFNYLMNKKRSDFYLFNLSKINELFEKDFPLLVLYCKNDYLVPFDQVEEFWKNKIGIDCVEKVDDDDKLVVGEEKKLLLFKKRKMVLFAGENVEHVKMLVAEPERYKKEILDFVTNIFQLVK